MAQLLALSDYWWSWANMLVRGLHVVAAIGWIGSSFYFVFLDNNLQKPTSPDLLEKGVDGAMWAVHGGGFLPGYSGRIDHAWGAREDSHAKLPLPPTTYLRQVYLDTVVFSYHQLAYLVELFGPDRILMGSDYPFDMAEYNPVGHVAGIGLDDVDFFAWHQ